MIRLANRGDFFHYLQGPFFANKIIPKIQLIYGERPSLVKADSNWYIDASKTEYGIEAGIDGKKFRKAVWIRFS